MYNIDWLKNEFESEDRLKYLFFWGHTPHKEGITTSSCLSQWWECEFESEGLKFKSTEHWMMYGKALLFNDYDIAEQILKCESPGEAKALGRKVSNFDNDIWNQHRMGIVVEGNRLKFSQNEDFKTFLLNTKQRVLVEASPVDEIWGVGLSRDSDKINNPNSWRGLNLLGFALMEVRDILKGITNWPE
ncbi:MAG: ribA/ribD-fused uncharacterized protein [Salibacteraceae bacterium]|jgi:ribA/ribD-fused uncharacterized protein